MLRFMTNSPQTRRLRRDLIRIAGVLAVMGMAGTASANGCIVVRPSAPLTVGLVNAHEEVPGRWEFTAAYRYLYSDRHFRGSNEEHERQQNDTDVRNTVHTVDYTLSYRPAGRWRLSASVPWIEASRSSLYEHDRVNRHTIKASGIGDLRLMAYRDMLGELPRNVGGLTLGAGVKLPTGDERATDTAYTVDGPEERPVDQSIQLGDGGTGLILELQAYHRLGSDRTFAFFSGSYLINPQEKNGVRTYRETLSPRLQNEAVMSVPDQFQLRTGVAHSLVAVQALTLELALRAEGVPVEDLVGGSGGFRRPGYAVYVEPSLSYSRGRHLANVSVPVALRRNRLQSVTDKERGSHGDAAFADTLLLLNYSFRF